MTHSSFQTNDNQKGICFSAPGKMIIMGEHAVLHGHPCIIAAVDRRITARLESCDDIQIVLESDTSGHYETDYNQLLSQDISDFPSEWRFVLTACQKILKEPVGFKLSIQSDFPPTIGLGSSAAVTVAVSACLLTVTANNQLPGFEALFKKCHDVVYTAQGKEGSGADLAASILGGLVYFHPGQSVEQNKNCDLNFTAVYSGYKTPTVEVIQKVRAETKDDPQKAENLYQDIGELTQQGWHAIQNNDHSQLGRLMNDNHTALQQLGVSDDTLDHLVNALKGQSGVMGAKLSGAGLGDCVIGLGEANPLSEHEMISLPLAKEGLRRE